MIIREVIDNISIARQPIFDESRNVVAYELFNRSHTKDSHTVASDISLALNAIVNNGAPISTTSTALFVHALHDGLAGPHWEFLEPQSVVVTVQTVPNHDPSQIVNLAAALGALRSRRFRLCFNHAVVAPNYKAWQSLADFVKIDLATVAAHQLKPLVSAITSRTPAVAIATKVETAEQFNQLKTLGLKRFQGYWFSAPEIVKPRVLAPSEVWAIRLFNLVSKQASIDDIEECLKKDEALGVNLLRIINSAGFGLGQKVTSLRQAVMLMGFDKLVKWSALVLATASSKKPSILTSSAIVRGRMMELLAEFDRTNLNSDTAFLIGLLSQIEAMLGCPLQVALDQLSLSEEIIDALLNEGGTYGAMLTLAKACESDNESQFTRAFSQLKFTLRQINVAQMKALVWADSALAS
jgi:EAL and modified HD-GYP domain-containing signal transduction protein